MNNTFKLNGNFNTLGFEIEKSHGTINVKINQINEKYEIMNDINRLSILECNITIFNGCKLCKGSLHSKYVLQLKVSSKMNRFSIH